MTKKGFGPIYIFINHRLWDTVLSQLFQLWIDFDEIIRSYKFSKVQDDIILINDICYHHLEVGHPNLKILEQTIVSTFY